MQSFENHPHAAEDAAAHQSDATIYEQADDVQAYEQAENMLWIMLEDLLNPEDRPEMWAAFPQFLAALPELPRAARNARRKAHGGEVHVGEHVKVALEIVVAMCEAHSDALDQGLERLTLLSTVYNQATVVQGALFHLHGMADPQNPKYRLEGRFCPKPFDEFHVLENSTHLCCASWMAKSAGDLNTTDWKDVWNSESAQAVRASIHDGSYRHCNKMACPLIQSGRLLQGEQVATQSPRWQQIVEQQQTALEAGPVDVNLAYDRTCNLSCPSCRVTKYAADEATRTRYDVMQERNILPMLKEAESVFITGSGDPFASKNFRRLLEKLTADEYPDLKFRIMTNAMLFTPREWERFPALHKRITSLQISIDGASKDTHELLRRGARWEVMEKNLDFAAGLLAEGLVEGMSLSFTVQVENFHEMGLAAELAERLKVNSIYFGQLTNWGTFTPAEFARKTVFVASHPQHQEFLAAMADPRLRSPRVNLGNLTEFLPPALASAA
jgi:organic radical activating enzyme